jgi:ElaB/YqjD/DUF883 family membrane-anchored ribosome-binding protein
MPGTKNGPHTAEHGPDLSETTEHLKEKAVEIGRSLREMGEELGGAAKDQFGHLRDKASGFYESGRKRARNFEGSIEEYIQEKPIKAIVLAAGAGLLLGLFWRRR